VSSASPNPSTPTDEADIERAVRAILFPLDQELERSTNRGCSLFALVIAPLLFLGLAFGLELNTWVAIAVAIVVPFCAWAALSAWLDARAGRRAAVRFNEHFPEGHPARPLAIQMLSELEYANKAQDRLREALQRASRG
jgi:hypothetical protein